MHIKRNLFSNGDVSVHKASKIILFLLLINFILLPDHYLNYYQFYWDLSL